jgi:hypothetical protein
MEAIIPLIILLIIAVPVALLIHHIWLHTTLNQLKDEVRALQRNLREERLSKTLTTGHPSAPAPQTPAAPIAAPAPPPFPQKTPEPDLSLLHSIASPEPDAASPIPTPPPMVEITSTEQTAPVPPLAPSPVVPPRFIEPPPLPRPAFNIEQFLGKQLIPWVAGIALFLGVVFFIKYSFEKNLITPAMRVAIGYLTGVGLLTGGYGLHRREKSAPAQSLCATGVLVLYGATFGAASMYHLIDVKLGFLIMALITATAFLMAMRLNALVIAILGMLGGFLTPVLLSSGEDHPYGLFGFIALLDLGLVALAMCKRWSFLAVLGALGTVLMLMGWTAKFFVPEAYHLEDKVLIPMSILLGFGLLYLGAFLMARRQARADSWIVAPAILMPVVALVYAFFLMSFPSLASRPVLLFGYVFAADLTLLALTWSEERHWGAQLLGGSISFLLLAVWTMQCLGLPLLNQALCVYFVFAVLHTVWPMVMNRLKRAAGPVWLGHFFPMVAIVLIVGSIIKVESAPLIVWPVILLVDLLAITMAVVTAAVFWIPVALILTLIAAFVWLGYDTPAIDALPQDLLVIGVFALVFVAAGIVAMKKLSRRIPDVEADPIMKALGIPPATVLTQIPAVSAILPFLLLIMVSLRLPLLDPSPVFGLAMLLTALLLGMTRVMKLDWLPLVTLGSVLFLEHAWHLRHFVPASAVLPLVWYSAFFLVVLAFPFVCLRQVLDRPLPWVAAALSGPLHFFLVHRVVKAAWPNEFMGLLPVVFAVPMFAGLAFLVRAIPANAARRMTLLAWFGGVALFFVTLIFPIQFDRQWITVGWALEGAALFWLFRRIPHPGLRLTATGLLIIVFIRLALNPAVLSYHERTSFPIFNWYLYTYGLAIASMFAGARLLDPSQQMVMKSNVRALLCTLGTILAFLLLNIEIADYFASPDSTALTFEFSGNFARDMSYSIAWALFALGLLIIGLWKQVRPARYSGIGLLIVTLLKLFFHDLANLAQLYRIGALIGVAVIGIVASLLYQKFFPNDSEKQ